MHIYKEKANFFILNWPLKVKGIEGFGTNKGVIFVEWAEKWASAGTTEDLLVLSCRV